MQLGLRVARLLPKVCMSTAAYSMHFLCLSLCVQLSVQLQHARSLSLSKRHGCMHANAKQSNRVRVGQRRATGSYSTAEVGALAMTYGVLTYDAEMCYLDAVGYGAEKMVQS
jgi:hypothetical protein